MNREIKFRCWLENEKRFMYTHFIEKIGFATFDSETHKNTVKSHPQQYTGVKDKGGQEIYEGDILEDSFGKYEVIFKCGKWLAFILNEKPYCKSLNRICASTTIVGHIYE